MKPIYDSFHRYVLRQHRNGNESFLGANLELKLAWLLFIRELFKSFRRN